MYQTVCLHTIWLRAHEFTAQWQTCPGCYLYHVRGLPVILRASKLRMARYMPESCVDIRATGVACRRLRFVPKEAVLSSALLAATVLAAALLFTLTAFAFLSFAVLSLSVLLSGGVGFARFVWILLCVHDASLC